MLSLSVFVWGIILQQCSCFNYHPVSQKHDHNKLTRGQTSRLQQKRSQLLSMESFLSNNINNENKDTQQYDYFSQSRRSVIAKSLSFLPFLPLMPSSALAQGSPPTSTVSTATSTSSITEYPPITHKVFMEVRVSRSDGSFYVRDDLPDIPENQVLSYNLTFGLFGTIAPVHVDEFLKYVTVKYDPLDDNPLPSYNRGVFTRLDQTTGLLQGGNIPGLEVTSIGGGTAIKYRERILPSPLWIEKKSDALPLSHQLGKGLLTHRTLDLTPEFEITTRSNPELDSTHVVFGRLLIGDETNINTKTSAPSVEDMQQNIDFLNMVQDLPTYSMDRPVSPTTETSGSDRAAEAIASTVFSKQREIFRGAAKTFGDTRLEKIYEGKLLRKVMITRTGLL